MTTDTTPPNPSFPRAVTLAWAYRDALQRLGFPADAIHVVVTLTDLADATVQVVRVRLAHAGLVHDIDALGWPDEPEEFDALWSDFRRRLDAGKISLAEREEMRQKHVSDTWLPTLAAILDRQGFRIPAMADTTP